MVELINAYKAFIEDGKKPIQISFDVRTLTKNKLFLQYQEDKSKTQKRAVSLDMRKIQASLNE